jgi:hypothetical protein
MKEVRKRRHVADGQRMVKGLNNRARDRALWASILTSESRLYYGEDRCGIARTAGSTVAGKFVNDDNHLTAAAVKARTQTSSNP